MAIIDSRIDSVKLYHNGATVYRTAELTIEKKALPDEIELAYLPLSLVDATVRLRVEPQGKSKAKIVATGLRIGLCTRPPEETLEHPATQQREEVEQSLLKKRQLAQHIETEQRMLSSIGLPERPEGEKGKPPPASPMAARIALEEFKDNGIQQRTEELRALREEIEELERERRRLADQERRASQSRTVQPNQLYKTVVAQLKVDGNVPKKLNIQLEYYVPGVRWVPSYQCRLSRDGQHAQLQLRALLCQRSGEDWQGARLILSTASPMRWTELPELSSIRIGRAQPSAPPQAGFRPPPQGAQDLFLDYDRDNAKASRLLPSPSGWQPPSLHIQPFSIVDLQQNLLLSLDELDADDEYGEFEEEADTSAVGAMFGGMGSGMVPRTASAPDGGALYGSGVSAGVGGPGGGGAAMQDALAMAKLSSEIIQNMPAAEAPARKRAKKKKGAKRSRDMSEKKKEERMELALELGLAASFETPLYTQLVLGSPQDPLERGKLTPIETRQTYIEFLQRTSLHIRIDVMQQVRIAAENAASVFHNVALPNGTYDVSETSGHFDFAYETDAVVDVPSDGEYHSITVGTREASCDMRYIVVPREDPNVYRMALLKNPLHAPLLTGPVEVYVGDEYVLTTLLPTVAPNAEFHLWLGVEQAIKCARNTKFKESRSGSKVVAMSELEHTLDIELRNNLNRTVQCEVHERIPQPGKDAEVVVEEGKVEPPWEVYNQEDRKQKIKGGRRWKVSLSPKTPTRLQAEYVVKIYANNELVGGNRREV